MSHTVSQKYAREEKHHGLPSVFSFLSMEEWRPLKDPLLMSGTEIVKSTGRPQRHVQC